MSNPNRPRKQLLLRPLRPSEVKNQSTVTKHYTAAFKAIIKSVFTNHGILKTPKNINLALNLIYENGYELIDPFDEDTSDNLEKLILLNHDIFDKKKVKNPRGKVKLYDENEKKKEKKESKASMRESERLKNRKQMDDISKKVMKEHYEKIAPNRQLVPFKKEVKKEVKNEVKEEVKEDIKEEVKKEVKKVIKRGRPAKIKTGKKGRPATTFKLKIPNKK